MLLFCCASVSFMLFSTFAFANTFVSVVCQSIFYAAHTPSSPLSTLSPPSLLSPCLPHSDRLKLHPAVANKSVFPSFRAHTTHTHTHTRHTHTHRKSRQNSGVYSIASIRAPQSSSSSSKKQTKWRQKKEENWENEKEITKMNSVQKS